MIEQRRRLLDHARRGVTEADISELATCIDPGYPSYVRSLTAVLHGSDDANAVDWEPLFHAPTELPTSEAHRRYRVFAAAIGLLRDAGFMPYDAIAAALVEDSAVFADVAPLAHGALLELGRQGEHVAQDDSALLMLGALIAGIIAGADTSELRQQLVESWDYRKLDARWAQAVATHAPGLFG